MTPWDMIGWTIAAILAVFGLLIVVDAPTLHLILDGDDT